MKYRILCLGTQWRGANDGSIFRAFSRQGHLIDIVDNKFYVPSEIRSFGTKVIVKVSRKLLWNDYNKAIIRSIETFRPDVICVFKGNCVLPSTLSLARNKGIPIFCIYPDVSFYDHGWNIPLLVKFYDYIFTTKSYGMRDLNDNFNYNSVALINHSIDPEVHRYLSLKESEFKSFKNDVSFIGTYSYKKEYIINYLINNINNLEVKIWGPRWNNSKSNEINHRYMKQPIYGDLYAIGIQKSKINLGLLSEAGTKSSSGDLITSRSFHIPGAGGFMLHERTKDILEIFKEEESVVTFADNYELIDKIKFYLNNDSARNRIRKKGHEVVWKYHKSDDRVNFIIDTLVEKGILPSK